MSPTRANPETFCVDCRASGTVFAHPVVGKSSRCDEHRLQRDRHMARGRQIRFRRGEDWTAEARRQWAEQYVPTRLEPEFRRGALLTREDLEDIVDAYLALQEAADDAGNKFRRGDLEALRSGLTTTLDAIHEAKEVLKRIPGIAETRRARQR